jgi:glyoxylase-like metal-dependent hydrolase (beta-lactamase superfamily II)
MRIHQVKTRLVNTYVIEYPERLFVMDVAIGCHRYVLGFIEQELERNIHDVELVICSHDDPDHMGGVKRLAALCDAAVGIPLSAGAPHHKFWNDPFGFLVRAVTSLQEGLRARMWDMYFNPKRSIAARKQPKYLGKRRTRDHTKRRATVYRLQGGTLPGFEDWKVIHTPGHSWDSCCYYHGESGSLLSGDTLLGSAKMEKVVVPSIYANAEHTKQSLAMLRNLPIKAVYPGHGSVITRNISF